MKRARRLWRRLRDTVSRSSRADEVADGIELHIRLLTEEFVRA